jgi:hypothetical protein
MTLHTSALFASPRGVISYPIWWEFVFNGVDYYSLDRAFRRAEGPVAYYILINGVAFSPANSATFEERKPTLPSSTVGYVERYLDKLNSGQAFSPLQLYALGRESQPKTEDWKQLADTAANRSLRRDNQKKYLEAHPEEDPKREAKEAESAEHTGSCGYCIRSGLAVSSKGRLSTHGYTRPGYGFIQGKCPGSGMKPFEVSQETLLLLIEHVKLRLEQLDYDLQEGLLSAKEVVLEYPVEKRKSGGRRVVETAYKTVKRGEPGFAEAQESAIKAARGQQHKLETLLEQAEEIKRTNKLRGFLV